MPLTISIFNENKNLIENKDLNKNENEIGKKQEISDPSTSESLHDFTRKKEEVNEKIGIDVDIFNHADSRINSPSSSSRKHGNEQNNSPMSSKSYNFSFFNKDKKTEKSDNKIQINETEKKNEYKNENKNEILNNSKVKVTEINKNKKDDNNKDININKSKDNNKNREDCSTRSISDNGTSDDGENHLNGIFKGKCSFDSNDLTTVFLSDYLYPFDGKGVLSYLGTEGKSKSYRNPHKSGPINIFIIFLFFIMSIIVIFNFIH